jgi:serine/threonine protein kinase
VRRPIIYYGSYGLIREIGSGGMGKCYEAEDLLGRPFCVKMIHPELSGSKEMRERFRREARSLAQVRHPNVVSLHGYYEEGGVAWLVMPLLQGETVATRLGRPEVCPLPELYRIGREAALGLAAIHACDVVHRDVKPGNLFLEVPDDRVIVMDFGLALRRGDTQLTQTDNVPGTDGYVAPERLAGVRGEASSDLYGLGATLWQLAAGRTKLDAPGWLLPPASVHRPDLPDEADDLILAMLSARPSDRPGARAVADALASLERR